MILRFLSPTSTRIRLGIFRRQFKRATDTMALIQLIALTRLRLHFSLPLVGEDETLDDQLCGAVDRFLGLGSAEDNSQDAEEKHLRWLREDSPSNKDREIYLRVSIWLHQGTDREEDVVTLYKSAYGNDIEPIADSELRSLFTDVRRKSRRLVRAHRESKATLIKISLKELNLLLPWISLLLIFSGYYYTSILYSKLGIDSDRFFSVGDYISSSINQLPHAAYGIAAYFVGMIYANRKISTETKFERESRLQNSEAIRSAQEL